MCLITLSGADESVTPKRLHDIWANMPSIELGVQYSRRRMGTPRYPCLPWLETLRDMNASGSRASRALRLSLHVNGSACADLAGGTIPPDVRQLIIPSSHQVSSSFSRLQANLRGACADAVSSHGIHSLSKELGDMGITLVLQSKPATLVLLDRLDDLDTRYDVLHDASEGRGERSCIPMARPGRWNGWAGGLNVLTVQDDIRAIQAMARANVGHGWGVDIETGLRDATGQQFSLATAIVFAHSVLTAVTTVSKR